MQKTQTIVFNIKILHIYIRMRAQHIIRQTKLTHNGRAKAKLITQLQ